MFRSFFLLMNWWIVSFTLCPFALVYSKVLGSQVEFSNGGNVVPSTTPMVGWSSPLPKQRCKQFCLSAFHGMMVVTVLSSG